MSICTAKRIDFNERFPNVGKWSIMRFFQRRQDSAAIFNARDPRVDPNGRWKPLVFGNSSNSSTTIDSSFYLGTVFRDLKSFRLRLYTYPTRTDLLLWLYVSLINLTRWKINKREILLVILFRNSVYGEKGKLASNNLSRIFLMNYSM